VKKILEYSLKILIFWAIVYFARGGIPYSNGYIIYQFFRFVFLCILFYGLFIHDIIAKKRRKEMESIEILKKYVRKEKNKNEK